MTSQRHCLTWLSDVVLREALLLSSSISLKVISSTRLSQLRTSNLGILHWPFSSINWSSFERWLNWSRLHSSIGSSSGSGSLVSSFSGCYKLSSDWGKPLSNWFKMFFTALSNCPFIHWAKWMALPLEVPLLFKIRHFSSIISSICFDTLDDLFCGREQITFRKKWDTIKLWLSFKTPKLLHSHLTYQLFKMNSASWVSRFRTALLKNPQRVITKSTRGKQIWL